MSTKITINSLAYRLIKDGILTEEAALEATTQAQTQKIPFIPYLVKQKLVQPKQLALSIAQNFNLSVFDLDTFDKTHIPTHLINEKLIRQHHVLPLWQEEQQLFLAITDPTNQIAIDEIKFYTGLTIQTVLVEEDKLNLLIENILTAQHQNKFNNLNNEILNEDIFVEKEKNNIFTSDDEDAPIVRYVHKILLDAVYKNASDIHFEPYENNYQIRFRIDGLLYVISSLPSNIINRINTRIKIMADLDIAERRLPQDGRFKITLATNKTIDFRVSTCPVIHGEKIVLRVLDSNKNTLSVNNLGLTDTQKHTFYNAIKKLHGIILVTGPTGSGKTLTLYTALNILHTSTVNICTVEDPVEIHLPGINQVNINPKAGLNFANVVRAFLRQDPDVIMVGEIRDIETAEIAIKAAQTGHLVLATLHTNSAAETLTRLTNIGIAPYNIATATTLIIAQRLVRRLCDLCKKEITIPTATLLAEGFLEKDLPDLKIYSSVGCKECTDGYKGRIGIFELLPITESIAQLIMQSGNSHNILQQAIHENMCTLRESSLKIVKLGITSLSEINRVINV